MPPHPLLLPLLLLLLFVSCSLAALLHADAARCGDLPAGAEGVFVALLSARQPTTLTLHTLSPSLHFNLTLPPGVTASWLSPQSVTMEAEADSEVQALLSSALPAKYCLALSPAQRDAKAVTQEPFRDVVSWEEYRYYIVTPDPSISMLVSVTLLNGYTEIYASTKKNGRPTRLKHDFANVDYPGNYIVIPPGEYEEVWVGVYGLTESMFLLSWQANFTEIAPGSPYLGYVGVSGAMHLQLNVQHKISQELWIHPLAGAVDVYLSQTNTDPSPNNSTWKAEGPGSHFVVLDVKDMALGTLYINVVGRAKDSRFLIQVGSQDDLFLLSHNMRYTRLTPANATSKFEVYSAFVEKDYPNNLEVLVESCEDKHALNFTLSLNTTLKSTNATHLFSQYATAPTVVDRLFTVNVIGNNDDSTYHIFVAPPRASTDITRFFLFNATMEATVDESGIVSLTVRTPISDQLPHIYRIYARELQHKSDVEVFNFHTVCAIERFGEEIGFEENSSWYQRQSNITLNTTSSLNLRKTYLINVVVEDRLGSRRAYQPLWLKDGEIFYAYDNTPTWWDKNKLFVILGSALIGLPLFFFVVVRIILKFLVTEEDTVELQIYDDDEEIELEEEDSKFTI